MSNIPSYEEIRNALVKKQGEPVVSILEKSTVAICGLGGLGSNIAICLARAGVGKLILIDFDKLDITNLQRQQYKANQLGMYKAEALPKNLLEIAPYLKVEPHVLKISGIQDLEILKNADLICEAFDNAEAKAMLTNLVLENLPEKFFVAGSGMAGYSSANEIRTRKITKNFYLCGDGVNDVGEVNYLIAPRVMTCAAHQALVSIRLLCGMEN